MVSRRRQTPLPTDQPVRFYKFVALTFLILTIVLLGIVIFMSAKRAVITITTKSTPIDVTADVTIGNTAADGVLPGIVTSTALALTEEFKVTGTREEPGIARGIVTLHNESSANQPLVRTTRLLTSDGVLFRLDEGTVVPAQGTVEVPVYADQAGATGNIGPVARFTIPGLNEAKQQVIYGSSDEAITGGVKSIGTFADADLEKAKKQMRIVLEEQWKAKVNAAMPAGHKAVYAAERITAQPDINIGVEAEKFTVVATGTVVGVFYDVVALADWGRKELEKRSIGDAEIVRPGGTEPTITFGSYDAQAKTATLHVLFDGIVTLNPDSKQIEREVFFGKTRDEVRRYLLSLDHVHKVEVELKPVWMQTVPHIHDHVSLIVREVE